MPHSAAGILLCSLVFVQYVYVVLEISSPIVHIFLKQMSMSLCTIHIIIYHIHFCQLTEQQQINTAAVPYSRVVTL